MFAPQSSPAGRFEGQNPKTKDVVFCERSAFPLAVPSALVTAIWDQVNEGLRAVPRGGAEVGGLLLGRQSQTGIVLAEEVVPIPIEYRFGPAFRLSDVDLHGIQTLMASVQKDPSKAVVGFYRSRTRNDSQSQESDSELLAALEQAHTSFTSNFHYYIAFTPLTKMSMTASISVRKDEGWDEWQHVTLRSNPMSATEPIEFEAPPKVAVAAAAAVEQPPVRPPVAPPVAPPAVHAEPPVYPHPEPYTPPQAPARVSAYAENRSLSHTERMAPAPRPPEQPGHRKQVAAAWYVGGAVLVGAIGLGSYLRIASPPQPRIIVSETPAVPPPTSSSVNTGFSAAREGPLWRLTWDRAAVAALNPTGGVLAIRDGGKEQQVGLTPSDLSSGTILYTPQTSDLLFSLNIVMPGSQVAEEHIRVLEAPRAADVPAEPSVKIVVHDQVRTLRPFTPVATRPSDSVSPKSAAEIPPPPALAASAAPALNTAIPISPAPAGAAPAARESREIQANSVPSPLPPITMPASPAQATVGPKVLRRVNPSFSGPMPGGAGVQVQVRVQIDAHGVVTKVTPAPSNGYVDFRLTEAAARAAQLWLFEPARTEGHPVPGEMILDFHFGGH